MSEMTLTPGKYDCFTHYYPEVAMGMMLNYLVCRHSNLKEIYNRSGVFAVLKEVFDNPSLYSFDVGDVDQVLGWQNRKWLTIENCRYLPEQLEDRIVDIIKDMPKDELSKENVARWTADIIFDDIGDGIFNLDELFWVHGMDGFPGMYNDSDYKEDLIGMLERAIDMDRIKEKLGVK